MTVAQYVYDDGGRLGAGFATEDVGDCTLRAIAIATQVPYKDVWKLFRRIARWERTTQDEGHQRPGRGRVKDGSGFAHIDDIKRVLTVAGWRTQYIPLRINDQLEVDKPYTLRELLEPYNRFFEFPRGRVLVMQPGHIVAVVDGVIHDVFDSSGGVVQDIWICEKKYADLWVLPKKAGSS